MQHSRGAGDTKPARRPKPLHPQSLSLPPLCLCLSLSSLSRLGLLDRVARVAMNDPTADSNCLCACAAARTRVRIPVASRPSGVLHDQAVSFSFTGCPPRLSPPRLPSAASAPCWTGAATCSSGSRRGGRFISASPWRHVVSAAPRAECTQHGAFRSG